MNLSKFDHKKYIAGCMVIGLFQTVDSLVAIAGIKNNLTTAFSLIELLWFLVTLVFFLAFKYKGLSVVLPSAYAVYYLFGWFYGSYLLSQEAELVLPLWYMVFAGLFGIFYMCMALFYHCVWRGEIR